MCNNKASLRANSRTKDKKKKKSMFRHNHTAKRKLYKVKQRQKIVEMYNSKKPSSAT